MTIGWIEEFVRDGEVVDGFVEDSRRKFRWTTVAAVAGAGAVFGQVVLKLLALYWGNMVVRR